LLRVAVTSGSRTVFQGLGLDRRFFKYRCVLRRLFLTPVLFLPLFSQVVVLSSVIISFVQSIALSKRMAYTHGYDVDSSQELISLGLANLVGAMFQSYPTTGAIAQSAAADDIGAETGIASVVTSLIVMLVLLFLTPVFQHMPLAVLGAIVIAFVSPMFVSTFFFFSLGDMFSALLMILLFYLNDMSPLLAFRTTLRLYICSTFTYSILLFGLWH
jgi:MFS superfamily sulfate permease-like transporter